jgi:leader peptidase (prepilin peptidase)/N-methyltransferase
MADLCWLAVAFVVGAIVGGWLNKCIDRLPLEKSLFWPGNRCLKCAQPIHWYHALPLVSYWQLGGRCRACRQRFSFRYFAIELLTALGFAGLYYLEVMRNVHDISPNLPEFKTACRIIFAYHAVLFSFLVVATFIDIDHQIIPLPLTFVGTIVGLIGAVLWPWPWPYAPALGIAPPDRLGRWLDVKIPQGLYPWPVWGPLPDWLPPGSVQLGLATGLAGLLLGTLALRVVRVCFGIGMGPEYMDEEDPRRKPTSLLGRGLSWFQRVGGKTMGLGDADLMMMAGAFLGWQPVLVSFFVATIPGLFFGLAHFILSDDEPPAEAGKEPVEGSLPAGRSRPFPFGPALAIGVVATFLLWQTLGPQFQVLLFFGEFLIFIAIVSGIFMVVAGYLIRWVRRLLHGQEG